MKNTPALFDNWSDRSLHIHDCSVVNLMEALQASITTLESYVT